MVCHQFYEIIRSESGKREDQCGFTGQKDELLKLFTAQFSILLKLIGSKVALK